jgi:hypothetical protein
MPGEIVNVVDAIGALRHISPQTIEQTVHENFLRLIGNDSWLADVRSLLSQEGHLGTA